MKSESFYYRCTEASMASIASDLHSQITETIELLPQRQTHADINFDLFWLLTSIGWHFESVPVGLSESPPDCLDLACTLADIQPNNDRKPCRTSTSLGFKQHADYAKQFQSGLVHLEVQFGPVDRLFNDLCGFRIAHAEERLVLGIEIVLRDGADFLERSAKDHHGATSFNVTQRILETVGLDCPVWLIGIG